MQMVLDPMVVLCRRMAITDIFFATGGQLAHVRQLRLQQVFCMHLSKIYLLKTGVSYAHVHELSLQRCFLGTCPLIIVAANAL